MANYKVKVLDTAKITHNVKRFKVERPKDYSFIPGQATDIALCQPGMAHVLRPFTFTSLADADFLEFIIKIYPEHHSVTSKLAHVKPGDELLLHEVFGTISYKGPGLFIAAGAGITPFIAIFRELETKGQLQGNRLIFANRTVDDIILREELQIMLGDDLINVVEISTNPSIPPKYISRDLVRTYVDNKNQYYYICGPESFNLIVADYLVESGVEKSKIVIEE